MMSETSWLRLRFLLARARRRRLSAWGRCDPVAATPKASSTWSLIRPAIVYCRREAAFSRLTQRAPFEIGEHAVELVGDLLELGQQVLLLLDGLVDLLLGGGLLLASLFVAAACPCTVVTGRRQLRPDGACVAGLLLALPPFVIGRLLRRFRSTIGGTPAAGFACRPASCSPACPAARGAAIAGGHRSCS